MVFTDFELEYLRGQRLGRLATLDPRGTLQNSPVGYRVDADAGVIDIRGRDMGNTRKFHNVAANGEVAFVVDDLASVSPWVVRGIEIRGTAEALTDQPPPEPYFSREVILIHPLRIITWGIGPEGRRASRAVA
ncbi:MAG: PPOX class F420-dependent oxidoreductase [Candidatus Dormibacteria bacterium]